VQNCKPTPIFEDIIVHKVELVKNSIEHVKEKVTDAAETGVETVKEMATAGAKAVSIS
jgi:hypothetical protein